MASPASGNGNYSLDSSAAVVRSLELLQRQASREGRGPAFKAAMLRILRDLRRNPLVVGEPLYRLAHLKLRVRVIVVSPVIIHYAVSETQPIVYLTSGKLLALSDQ